MRRVLMLIQFSRLIARAHVAAALLAAVSLVACAATFAQSGRRPPKPREIAPVPTPTPEPTPPPKDDRPAAAISLLVTANDTNFFMSTTRETDIVQGVIVARLRESSALDVSGAGQRIHRGEAIKLAKESRGRHVVWFEMRMDPRYERTARRPPPEAFQIDYIVLESGTAKRLTGGVVYLHRAYGTLGRVGLPPTCYPFPTHEVEYVFGALEVAERIMKSFSVPIPPRCR